jgi:hypothetical protein
MAPHPKATTPRNLEIHLAYEVDWLVYAAKRFSLASGKDAVTFQDSVFVHARNLLEFTKPTKPSFAWWIADHGQGGNKPTGGAKYTGLTDYLNANVTHLGTNREAAVKWPLQKKGPGSHIALARICLDRVDAYAPPDTDKYGEVMRRIVQLGRAYLDGDEALAKLDALTVK